MSRAGLQPKRPGAAAPDPLAAAYRRLRGIWQSDGPRTVKEWRFRKRVRPKHRELILALFGKLRVTYGRRFRQWQMDGALYRHRFEVLGSDPESVVIRYEDPLFGDWRLEHIRFEDGDRYWISVGGNREWFVRVKPTAAKPRSRRRPATVP